MPVPPLVEDTVASLLYELAIVPVTVPLNVHVAPEARVPPVNVMVSALGLLSLIVTVPPHAENDVAVTSRPAGRVVVKVTSVRFGTPAGLGLLMVNPNVDDSPVKIGLVPYAMLITGGAMTVKPACPKPTLGVVSRFGPVSVELIFVVVLV